MMKKLYTFLIALFFVIGVMGQNDGICESCLPDGIYFTTQDEIDNFQYNYPNCTEVEGFVYIEGFDVTNLYGLSVLNAIGGDLTIGGDEGSLLGVTDLSGLENLATIGGSLTIQNTPYLTSLTGLDGLDSIGGTLTIINNELLSTCEAIWLCNYLAEPNGIVNVFNNHSGCNSLPEISNACGIALPCLPYGNYYLLSQAEIDAFSTNYSGCTVLEGNVIIDGADISNLNGLNQVASIGGDLKIGVGFYGGNSYLTDLTGLGNITSIGGNLEIGNGVEGVNPSLISLTGMENLTSIGGDLDIIYVQNLSSLVGLNNVISIGGDLTIFNIGALTNLSGLNNLSFVGGSLNLEGNEALNSLTGLESLDSIDGSLYLGGNNSLATLTGLTGLSYVGGNVNINGDNSGLTTLSGLENLTSVEGYLTISGNDDLVTLTGLENLTSVGDALSIGWNPSLSSLSALLNLTSIGGNLVIGNSAGNGNNSLTNLSGLEGITSIGGNLEIARNNSLASLSTLQNLEFINGKLIVYGNDQLVTLDGLDNIAKESITDLSIYYNTSLSTCEIKSVCDYLANPNGEVTVYLNDIGCESQEEIIDSCEAHAGIIDGSSLANGLLIFPNPTSTTITIELPTQPSKNTSLTISNTNGQQLISQPITKPQTEIDISYLPVGIYIVKVWNDENVMVRKVVKQ